jgi:hypothetical protein
MMQRAMAFIDDCQASKQYHINDKTGLYANYHFYYYRLKIMHLWVPLLIDILVRGPGHLVPGIKAIPYQIVPLKDLKPCYVYWI